MHIADVKIQGQVTDELSIEDFETLCEFFGVSPEVYSDQVKSSKKWVGAVSCARARSLVKYFFMTLLFRQPYWAQNYSAGVCGNFGA